MKNSLFLMIATSFLCFSCMSSFPAEADRQAAPAPQGKLVDVGGFKLHIHQTGQTGPAVVLECGAGAFSFDWHLVQAELSKSNIVCSYDRAGHAWSELGPRPRTMKQNVFELRQLLKNSGIQPPYVLVGQSYGGMIIRVYASEYPDEVAGLVLVDPTIENNFIFYNGKIVRNWDSAKPRTIPKPTEKISEKDRKLTKDEQQEYEDFRKWIGPPKIEAPFDKLPEGVQKLRLWASSRAESSVGDQNPYMPEESLLLFAERIRQQYPLGSKPVVVLARKPQAQKADPKFTTQEIMNEVERTRIENIQSLTQLSSNSHLITADRAGHQIHLDQPELVIQAVRAVMMAIKRGSPVAESLSKSK